MTSSDEGEVLRATAELVRRSWELLGEAEARPPLRSDQIGSELPHQLL